MTDTTYVAAQRADAGALRAEARAIARQALVEGREISTEDLAAAFGRSRRWAQDRVAEAREELAREEEQRSVAQDGRSVDEPERNVNTDRRSVAQEERTAEEDPTLRDVATALRRTVTTRALARLSDERRAAHVPPGIKVCGAIVAAIAVGSALVISYVELAALAGAAGYRGWLRWLYPLCADGLLMTGLLTAWVRIRRGEPAGIRPVLALIVGGGATITGNIAAAMFHVRSPEPAPLWVWIPPLMAGYVPVAAALALEQALALVRAPREERREEK